MCSNIESLHTLSSNFDEEDDEMECSNFSFEVVIGYDVDDMDERIYTLFNNQTVFNDFTIAIRHDLNLISIYIHKSYCTKFSFTHIFKIVNPILITLSLKEDEYVSIYDYETENIID